ncbi:MAG: DUF2459 domain-containing protein [Verrucomicrobiales bacterium]
MQSRIARLWWRIDPPAQPPPDSNPNPERKPKPSLGRRLWRFLWRGTALFLLAVALYLAAAALLTWFPANADTTPPEPGSGVRIYVCSNGAHVDLCVPAAAAGVAWREFVPDSDFDIGMYARFYRFGWGDREFYERCRNGMT